jgi:hypothetical protein
LNLDNKSRKRHRPENPYETVAEADLSLYARYEAREKLANSINTINVIIQISDFFTLTSEGTSKSLSDVVDGAR